MIDIIKRLAERASSSNPLSGAYHNAAALGNSGSADVPAYSTRAALAVVLGALLLLGGISAIMYDAIVYGISPMTGDDAFSRGISSLLLGSVIPVIPGIPAIVHSIRVKRCLEAGDELEARRASNYARTWSRIALWTWVGLVASWMAFTLTLAAALAFILIVVVIAILAVVFVVLGGGLAALGGLAGGGGHSGGGGGHSGGSYSDDKDDDKRVKPGHRFSEYSARIRRIRELQRRRDRGG